MDQKNTHWDISQNISFYISQKKVIHVFWNDMKGSKSAAISLRLQGKLSFPYNCQKMNGQIYVLLC